jgi:FkbM family methyltransferase
MRASVSLRRIKHSFIGKIYRRLGHLAFALRFRTNEPVRFHLPRGIDIRLYPYGEIAEFLFYHRWFERTELDLVAGFLTPGMRVIDVGANIGLYSIVADRLVGARGRVWAFEPSSKTYQWLLDNLRVNGCASVIPIKLALSECGEELALQSDPWFGDAYRYLARRNATASTPSASHAGGPGTERVTTVTLDDYAETHDIRNVDFIKVDIEGWEYPFFRGARHVLTQNRNVVIMFENSPDWYARAGYRPQNVFALLGELGFGLYSWHQRQLRWDDSESSVTAAEMVWATRDRRRLPARASSGSIGSRHAPQRQP